MLTMNANPEVTPIAYVEAGDLILFGGHILGVSRVTLNITGYCLHTFDEDGESLPIAFTPAESVRVLRDFDFFFKES